MISRFSSAACSCLEQLTSRRAIRSIVTNRSSPPLSPNFWVTRSNSTGTESTLSPSSPPSPPTPPPKPFASSTLSPSTSSSSTRITTATPPSSSSYSSSSTLKGKDVAEGAQSTQQPKPGSLINSVNVYRIKPPRVPKKGACIQTVEDLLTKYDPKPKSQYAKWVPKLDLSWEEFFLKDSTYFQRLGMSPRERRYILWLLQKYRQEGESFGQKTTMRLRKLSTPKIPKRARNKPRPEWVYDTTLTKQQKRFKIKTGTLRRK